MVKVNMASSAQEEGLGYVSVSPVQSMPSYSFFSERERERKGRRRRKKEGKGKEK